MALHNPENEPARIFNLYEYQHLSPVEVVRETATCLDLLNLDIADKQPALSYLRQYTGEFLDGVLLGYKLSNSGGATTYEDTHAVEAFNFALVTFSYMPEIARNPMFEGGFSRRGTMAPPETSYEFQKRIEELREVHKEVVRGGGIQFIMPETLRYYWFYKTGSEIPLKFDTTKSDIQAEIAEKWSKMLDGVDVDI